MGENDCGSVAWSCVGPLGSGLLLHLAVAQSQTLLSQPIEVLVHT